jgi:hypothetical protein
MLFQFTQIFIPFWTSSTGHFECYHSAGFVSRHIVNNTHINMSQHFSAGSLKGECTEYEVLWLDLCFL